jgi:hypothetical protein
MTMRMQENLFAFASRRKKQSLPEFLKLPPLPPFS